VDVEHQLTDLVVGVESLAHWRHGRQATWRGRMPKKAEGPRQRRRLVIEAGASGRGRVPAVSTLSAQRVVGRFTRDVVGHQPFRFPAGPEMRSESLNADQGGMKRCPKPC
jgi:hypothetical protein